MLPEGCNNWRPNGEVGRKCACTGYPNRQGMRRGRCHEQWDSLEPYVFLSCCCMVLAPLTYSCDATDMYTTLNLLLARQTSQPWLQAGGIVN